MASSPLVSQLRLYKALLCTAVAQFPLILYSAPSGLSCLSLLGSCLHICIVTLGLAASLTSTMASVILLELPMALPAPQVLSLLFHSIYCFLTYCLYQGHAKRPPMSF